jgi:DNA-binding MarR family transcriptional regulator
MVTPKKSREPDVPCEESFIYDFLPYLLSHAQSLDSKQLDYFAVEASIAKVEFKVLIRLVGNESLSLGQLAYLMQSKQSTLSRIVDLMVSSGLVQRRESETDRRRIEVTITKKGLKLVTPYLPQVKEIENDALKCLGDRDFKKLKHLLRTLIESQYEEIGRIKVKSR